MPQYKTKPTIINSNSVNKMCEELCSDFLSNQKQWYWSTVWLVSHISVRQWVIHEGGRRERYRQLTLSCPPDNDTMTNHSPITESHIKQNDCANLNYSIAWIIQNFSKSEYGAPAIRLDLVFCCTTKSLWSLIGK